MKSWLFGILYLLFSLYGIKMQLGNTGHEAHVGGAITGVLTVVCLKPKVVLLHPWVLAGLLIPFIAFMVLLVRRPAILMIENYWGFGSNRHPDTEMRQTSRDEAYLNQLLEKVSENGMESLSRREKRKLEQLSRNIK